MEQAPHNACLHPVALAIAGSDSGGGAGIQADLRAFAAFGIFGTTAITALTAQNPTGVSGIQGTEPTLLRKQIQAVRESFSVGAVKTGMLFSAELVAVVADALADWDVPLVIDPVMVATSGAKLLLDDAVTMMKQRLLPRAALVTPNIPEADILAGGCIATPDDVIDTARRLADELGCPVLVKGGHHASAPATDILATGQGTWRISAPVVQARSTHGTGCSLSSACAAVLAANADASILDAVVHAKAYVSGALANCRRTGPHTWSMWPPEDLPLDKINVHRIGDYNE